MTPALLKTTGEGPMILVPERIGDTTERWINNGAVRMPLAEILSRFS